jgi:DNA repair exonuclease SbcCD ATPase subunit
MYSSSVTQPRPGLIPLSPQETQQLKEDLLSCVPQLEKIGAQFLELKEKEANIRLREAQIEQKKVQIEQSKAQIEQSKVQIEQKQNEIIEKEKQAQALHESSQAKLQLAQQIKASNMQKLQQVNESMKVKIAGIFYSVFNLKPELNQIDTILSTYGLSNFSSKQSPIFVDEQKKCAVINSMKPFIQFLETNKSVTSCNFKAFKDEINDVETLASYLKESKCAVKALGITKNAQSVVDVAVKARSGQLKVQYFQF